ncbi:hypothetical protein J6590_022931 [Homalodisca vitripennis]|nr:hypothetical protein J6590_022931 [Homalodisca vitripennis]
MIHETVNEDRQLRCVIKLPNCSQSPWTDTSTSVVEFILVSSTPRLLSCKGISGNERADALANLGSASNMMRPQPFCGISRCESFGAVSKWVHSEYKSRCRLHPGLRMSKMVLQAPFPIVAMCDKQKETAEHLHFDCPAIARERYAIFGGLDKGGEFPQENLMGCFLRLVGPIVCFQDAQKALEAKCTSIGCLIEEEEKYNITVVYIWFENDLETKHQEFQKKFSTHKVAIVGTVDSLSMLRRGETEDVVNTSAPEVSEGEEEAMAKDQPCSCDACKDRRGVTENTVEEMRRLQAHWMDLRQYIRMVYRMAMEVKSPADGYEHYIKEHVQKLCMCDPHQLFQRLESQVQEFVIETKVRQLELLKREKDSPVLPYLFISGLLESYKKLMAAANELAPLLEQLQTEHLNKFNLTWKVLNQHLYQSCVYTDPFVQNKVPECIAKLSNSSPDPGDKYKKLVREFLSFDDEITLVGSLWREAETRIHQYNQEQATLKAKQRMMKEDWELFKAQRKLIHQKMLSKANSDLSGEATCHRSCPCDECAMSHLLSCGGLVTPPHSPSLPPTSDHNGRGRVEGEGREQSETTTECECHVCTAPPITSPVVDLETAGSMNLNLHGGGFHLYPHIHGTGGGMLALEPVKIINVFADL